MQRLEVSGAVRPTYGSLGVKRLSVALSTANPPHTHWTTSFPTYGIADRRFVITG